MTAIKISLPSVMEQRVPVAFSYVRFSTPRQQWGDSEDRQVRLAKDWCEKHKVLLNDSLELFDRGLSAFKGKNLETGASLPRFLDAVKNGRVAKGDYLLIESFDRLSRRPPVEFLELFIEIVRHGHIKIVTLTDGRVYSDDSRDIEGLIMVVIGSSRSNQESEQKVTRIRESWDTRRASGKAIKIAGKVTKVGPPWLVLSDDREQFVPIKARVKTVKLIFDWSIGGLGAYTIAQRLNQKRIEGFGKGGWDISYVNKILNNRAVLGEWHPHQFIDGHRVPTGKVLQGYFPAIISEEIFNRAAEARAQRRTGATGGGRRGKNTANLFSHIAKCGYCSSPMHYHNGGNNHGAGHYLRCSKALFGKGCHKEGTIWRYEHFETAFLTFITEVDLAAIMSVDQTAAKRAEEQAVIAGLNGKLEVLKAEREATYKLYLKDPTDFRERMLADKEAELKQAEADKTTHEQASANLERDVGAVTESRAEIEDLIPRCARGHPDADLVRPQIASRIKSLVDAVMLWPAAPASATGFGMFSVRFRNGQFRNVGVDPTNAAVVKEGWEQVPGQNFAKI